MAPSAIEGSHAALMLDFKTLIHTPSNLKRPVLPFALIAATTAAQLLHVVVVAQRTIRALVQPPVSVAITNVRYGVTFNLATARIKSLRVSMPFHVAGNGPVLLSLPA